MVAEKKVSNGMGIASLVLGILSLLSYWLLLFALIFGILAIIFAIIQKKKGPSGMATAGLVLGILGILFSILFIAGIVGLIMWASSQPQTAVQTGQVIVRVP